MEGVNSSMKYLIHFKNLCKCHYVLPPNTIIKEKNSFVYEIKLRESIQVSVMFNFLA
jgi:hypothetical protein